MKKITIALLALSLAGCAAVPKPRVAAPAHKSIAVKPLADPVAQPATPNQVIKRRWYDKFKIHPKWFHPK